MTTHEPHCAYRRFCRFVHIGLPERQIELLASWADRLDVIGEIIEQDGVASVLWTINRLALYREPSPWAGAQGVVGVGEKTRTSTWINQTRWLVVCHERGRRLDVGSF